jgi:ribonucleoside-diphosphate reductase alpha chain
MIVDHPIDRRREDGGMSHVVTERRMLSRERSGLTTKIVVGSEGHEVYITANSFEDGSLGEVFVTGAGKEGSTLQGVIHAWATCFSIALQCGADQELLIRKFHQGRFAPFGPSSDDRIGDVSSILDAVVKWLALHWGDDDLRRELGVGDP